MTLAALAQEPATVKLRPVARQPHLRHWHEELDYLEREVRFYRQLLRLGIHQGSEPKKPLLFDLLNEFSRFEDDLLPPLRAMIPSASREISTTEQPDFLSFAKKLEQHTQALRKLKSRFFPHAHELQAFSIW